MNGQRKAKALRLIGDVKEHSEIIDILTDNEFSEEEIREVLGDVEDVNNGTPTPPPPVDDNKEPEPEKADSLSKRRYERWKVGISIDKDTKQPIVEKLKKLADNVRITEDQAEALNDVQYGGNTYAEMYFLPEESE